MSRGHGRESLTHAVRQALEDAARCPEALCKLEVAGSIPARSNARRGEAAARFTGDRRGSPVFSAGEPLVPARTPSSESAPTFERMGAAPARSVAAANALLQDLATVSKWPEFLSSAV